MLALDKNAKSTKDCKFCHAVFYCGNQCRTDHWRAHHRAACPEKPSAKRKAAKEKKKAEKKKGVTKTYNCAQCGKAVEYETKHDRETSAKKGCERCRAAVFYCSRACQCRHWPEHKPHCKKADDPAARRRRK